jgi:hypothetical protein
MRFYQPMQLPGVDMLCDAQELTTVLQTRSVARQEGRPGVASELYGVTNWDFTFAGHKRQGDWQAALGVTVRVHHLAWYTMAGEAKRDYPAPIDAHSPWWREYPLVEDHFARLNTCLTRGAPRARVAVVHPIESLWLAFGQSDAGGAERDSLEAQFRDLAAWLVHGLIDADYVAESLLWRQRTAVRDGACAVGAMAYDTILVPGLATIRATTLELLERCADAGVRVLFVGRIPALVDALPSERARRLAARCPQVVPERAALLAALEDRREVRVRRADGAGCPDGLLHQLRSDGDARWLFVCNSGNQAHGRLAVGLRGRWQAELWDTAAGAVAPAAVRLADGWSEVAWDCQGAGHLLLRLLPAVEAPAAAAGPAAAPARAAQTGDWELGASAAGEIARLPEPYAIVRDEPNVLLLDQAVGNLDGGADEPLCEILRQDNAWRERLGWGRITSRIAQPWCDGALPREHRVRLRWTVRLEAPVSGARLALERADQAVLRLDGRPLAARPDGWWVDAAILTVPLPDLAAGSHVIEAELPYGRDTVLEWAYLLGEFGVRVEGSRALVTAAPASAAWGDLGPQGLPFYAGNLTYRVRLDHRGGRLALQAHRFRAPLLKVRLDGREAGAIAWAPWRVDLGEIAAGRHELELTCFGDRRNAFAQVHHAGTERHRWWGPDSWRSQGEDWSDEYVLAPHGVLSAPRPRGRPCSTLDASPGARPSGPLFHSLQRRLAHLRRDHVDGHHRDHDQAHDHRGGAVVVGAHALVEEEADAAGPHHAHHRGRAHVALEAVEGVADPHRQHLGDDAVDDLLQAVGAGGADALDRALVDRLDHLAEELAEDAGGVHEQRQGAGERPQPDRDHEEQREHHLVDRAQGVEQPPRRLAHPPGGDVGGGQQPEWDRAHHRQHGAPQGHVQGDGDLVDVGAPVVEVRLEEALGEFHAVAGVGQQQQGIEPGPVPGPGQERSEGEQEPGVPEGVGPREGGQSVHCRVSSLRSRVSRPPCWETRNPETGNLLSYCFSFASTSAIFLSNSASLAFLSSVLYFSSASTLALSLSRAIRR